MITCMIISSGLRRITIGDTIIDLPDYVPVYSRKQGEKVHLILGDFPEELIQKSLGSDYQVHRIEQKRKLSPRLTPEQVAEVERQLDENIAPYLIAKNMGITKAQVYHVSNKKKGK